ncbi:hypothetical protein GCM10010174_65530 [Kutzneria viridogrisea]|uniref:non-specific serine/threonine protein kinase n=1 Tax=Kutzneria viridogrisea TaxID=47990 RepID=A0ABR6BY57_9PSEU|nr:hypothetical protein [Kutzneria viridogrisea]
MAEDMTGQLISDRYELVRRIGAGGMGEVWQGWDRVLKRVVAMKRSTGTEARQLGDEACIGAGFQHNNIVSVYDLIDDGLGSPWIVMEHVPSCTLSKLLCKHRTLPPDRVAHIGAQIAAALQEVHAREVVHGDITPNNVLVTENDSAKLTDFGVARSKWNAITLTGNHKVRGTPPYMAPEVRSAPAVPASDVYSLGVTLYAAVEGAVPSPEGDRKPLRNAGDLAPLLTAMLETEPDDRPDAANVRRMLRTIAGNYGRTSTFDPVPPKPARRHVSAATIAGHAVCALVILGFMSASHATSPAAQSPRAVLGEPRGADPCSLLDRAVLSRFGDTELDTAYGNFDRCDVLVQNGSMRVDLEVQFQNPPTSADPLTGGAQKIGAVGIVRGVRESEECRRTLVLADGNLVVVVGRLGRDSGPADLCAMADAATDQAVDRLNAGPVARRPQPFDDRSLAKLTSCDLLDARALARLPEVDAAHSQPGFGDWQCRWDSPSANTSVDLRFDRNQPLSANDGTPVQVGSRPGYLSQGEDGPNSCAIRVSYRTYGSPQGPPTAELLLLEVTGDKVRNQLCGTATDLATAVAAKLPG